MSKLIGYSKIRIFNPTMSYSSLAVVPTSQASALQRTGRAGRTSEGICYRLYPSATFDSLPYSTPPEITRVDLTTPLVQLKSLGIDDLMKLEWVTMPPSESILHALNEMLQAKLISADGHLTVMGQKLAEFPVDIKTACMVRSHTLHNIYH